MIGRQPAVIMNERRALDIELSRVEGQCYNPGLDIPGLLFRIPGLRAYSGPACAREDRGEVPDELFSAPYTPPGASMVQSAGVPQIN
jgi:hypothetical protein